MKNIHKLLYAITAILLSHSSVMGQRSETCLNFGWKFHAGSIENAMIPTFDDSGWRIVNVPHDFQIEQPWVVPSADEKADESNAAANVKSRLSSRAFKEMGQGWYRLHFVPSDTLKGKRIVIQFDGVLYTADIYLNGEIIGCTNYGYVGFEIDVTDKIRFGQDNVLAVMADSRQPNNSRWYTGAGIFRSVRMVVTSKDNYFSRHPLYVRTRENKYVDISVEVEFHGREKNISAEILIKDPEGNIVYSGKDEIKRTTPTRIVEQKLSTITIKNPLLWDTDHPNLYTVIVSLRRPNGTIADMAQTRFGIRTIEIGPSFGLKINGKKVLLKGYANHHTLGALGAAAYPRAIEKRIAMMKQWGINHIRTSHNPYSREFIELCDKYGILVVDELYDKWNRQYTGGRVPFEQLWQTDIPEWIKRDRNSPSVVMWSLGNELQQDANQPFNDYGVTMYRLMRPLVQRYDSTRLVTVAMHPRYRNWQTDSLPCDLAMITDVQSYNYRYMYFPGDSRRFPWMTFYQSEASVAAMGQNYFEMDLNRVIGLAYWGAIDYLGESQGWPAKGWSQGVFCIDLEPKPKAYYMRSFFKPDEPVVHIAVIDKKGGAMWNGVQTGNDGMSDHWNRNIGIASEKPLTLITYTNAEEVELVLNGKSIGKKANPKEAKFRNQIRWNNIIYQPGTLEAIARNSGKVVARHKIETTGTATKLVADVDNSKWMADGLDLQHVRIIAVDKKGRRVPDAKNIIKFSVEGPADIVGVINGDLESNEMTVGNTRSIYNGSCTVILRSKQKAGAVKLLAQTEGMKDLKLNLITHDDKVHP